MNGGKLSAKNCAKFLQLLVFYVTDSVCGTIGWAQKKASFTCTSNLSLVSWALKIASNNYIPRLLLCRWNVSHTTRSFHFFFFFSFHREQLSAHVTMMMLDALSIAEKRQEKKKNHFKDNVKMFVWRKQRSYPTASRIELHFNEHEAHTKATAEH